MNDQRVSAKADQATSGASSKRMEGHASSDVPVSAAAARSDGGTGLKVSSFLLKAAFLELRQHFQAKPEDCKGKINVLLVLTVQVQCVLIP